MAWLIGIVVLILAIVFWRVSLVILAIGAVALIVLWRWNENQATRKREAAIAAAQARLNKIQYGMEHSSPKNFEIIYQDDPASNAQTARIAKIKSDDDICEMTIELRLDGSKLTGLYCPSFEFDTYNPIYVKFDGDDTSLNMGISNYKGIYGDSDSVYISSYQGYKSNLEYDGFINKLKSNNTVAIKLHTSSHWVRFNLAESERAISALGTQRLMTGAN